MFWLGALIWLGCVAGNTHAWFYVLPHMFFFNAFYILELTFGQIYWSFWTPELATRWHSLEKIHKCECRQVMNTI